MSCKKILLFGALLALSLASCQKETETAAPTKTKTQQLTALPWHITSWTVTAGSGTPQDKLATLPVCQRDNRFVFNTNGVRNELEGPTQCSAGTPQTLVDTRAWNFNTTQTVLSVATSNMSSAVTPYEVVTLNNDAMQLRYSRSVSSVQTVDVITYAN